MTTWEQVREEWGKAEQMGFQAVLQAAKVGQMLIELKAECKHGEFVSNLTRVLGIEKKETANMAASRLMTLARNQPLIEEKKPESQRAALQLIKEVTNETEGDKVKKRKVIWPDIAGEVGILSFSASGDHSHSVRKAIDEIDPDARKLNDEARIRIACKAVKAKQEGLTLNEVYKEHRKEAETLTESAKQKLERIAANEKALLNDMFRAEVRKEFERSQPERLAELENLEKKREAEIRRFQMQREGIGQFMTIDEYRLVKGVCHPDREADKERKEKAFNIMQRLEEYFEKLKD